MPPPPPLPPPVCAGQVKHYAPSATAQEAKKASEALFHIFKAVLAEFDIRLEDLAGGTTDAGPDVRAMCVNFLLEPHKIWWDWCSCHLADKAAEHAFGTAADPQKSKNKEARKVVQLVIKAAAKVNQSPIFKQKFEEAQLEMLQEVFKSSKHAPQRWLSLVRVMERIIRLWHVLRRVYADAGDEFPLDKDNNKDEILQLYSLLQPLAAITRDGQYGAVPMTAEIHMAFAHLKTTVLDPEKPLRVYDVPAAPNSPEAEQAAQAHEGQRGKPPLPSSMVNPDSLRPAAVKCRQEMSKGLVQSMYSKVWDDATPDPSPFRDAAVVLTPSYNNKDYLMDLGLTINDEEHLPASKKHLAPTVESDAEQKYDGRWKEMRGWAVKAARKENSRAASSGMGGQPPAKRSRVLDGVSRPKEPRFASYGRGAHPGSEEQQLKQQVDAEIERYNALYVRADEVCCNIENGFAEEEKNNNGRGECELICCIRLAFPFCWR